MPFWNWLAPKLVTFWDISFINRQNAPGTRINQIYKAITRKQSSSDRKMRLLTERNIDKHLWGIFKNLEVTYLFQVVTGNCLLQFHNITDEYIWKGKITKRESYIKHVVLGTLAFTSIKPGHNANKSSRTRPNEHQNFMTMLKDKVFTLLNILQEVPSFSMFHVIFLPSLLLSLFCLPETSKWTNIMIDRQIDR